MHTNTNTNINISFIIASKYLDINFTKEVKHLCSENYKISMKEIESDKKNGKILHALLLEELLLSKCPYYSKQYTDLMHSLSNYQQHFSQN